MQLSALKKENCRKYDYMHILNWLLWGFVATLILTTIMAFSQQYRMTRMNLPFILGTMFTPDRDSAKIVGFLFHIGNGWVFSFVHIAIFESLSYANWLSGLITGFVHGVIVISVILPLLPGIHPRMASEFQPPTTVRQLEPPGFMGLHYGIRTPISILFSHSIYGLILGAFYNI
jgi:hypothetical protein